LEIPISLNILTFSNIHNISFRKQICQLFGSSFDVRGLSWWSNSVEVAEVLFDHGDFLIDFVLGVIELNAIGAKDCGGNIPTFLQL
jgi:hypothetical protein